MSEKSFPDDAEVPENVAIESKLPLTAIDIESQKDMESGRYHALRSLHKWFAARPTPAVRLAVLASVYPGEIDSDELLRLMKIGPKELDTGIADYVEKKFTEKKGSGTLDDHYGYPNPNTQSPTDTEIEKLEKELKERQDRLDEQLNGAQSRLEDLRKKREDATQEIPQPILSRYEFIRSRLSHPVIVPVDNGVCTGCHISIPPQSFIELQKGEQILSCPNCQRLLFWDNHFSDNGDHP